MYSGQALLLQRWGAWLKPPAFCNPEFWYRSHQLFSSCFGGAKCWFVEPPADLQCPMP